MEEARIITTKLQNHERGYYDIWQRIIEISKEEMLSMINECISLYDEFETTKAEEVLKKLQCAECDENIMNLINDAIDSAELFDFDEVTKILTNIKESLGE